MDDSFTIYTLLLLIGCLLFGVFFAWLLYSSSRNLDKRMRYALATVRAIVLSGILFLLFSPLIRRISYHLEKPVIVIGQDNSLSAGKIKPAGFNQQQYEKDLQALADRLGEAYDVRRYNFSDSVKTGFDFSYKGQLSNGFQFINQLNDQLLNRNVGAIILATDGIFNRGGSPLYDINKLKAPVYTIALGDTIPKKDVLVANVNHNDLVYLDNEFNIEVQVEAFESKSEVTRLTVLENGKQIYEENIAVNNTAFVKTIPVKLKANKFGLQKYTVQLSKIANEVSEKNNIRNIFVNVIDGRKKILIAAAGPHPDIAAIRQSILLNKYYDLKIVLGEELNAVKINDYSLVILYQLPATQGDGNAFLNNLQKSTIPVWYILGAQSNLAAFNQLQKQVVYQGNGNLLQEAFGYVDPNFTAFDLNPIVAAAIETFDPLQGPLGKVSIAGNAAVALNQRIGKIKTGTPLLFFINENGKKIGYLMGEGMWRWRLSEAQQKKENPVFNILVSNVVQYLSAKDDKRKFKVYTAKNDFDENEHVIINGLLYNDSYEPVNTPDVSVTIKNSAGKNYNFRFSRTSSAYQLDAGSLPAGNYTYQASVTLGSNRYTASGVFYVNALMAEFQQTRANHQLLNALSEQTGGKMYLPKDLSAILKDISASEQIKTISYEDRKYEELINFKWLFALILCLLTAEWFIRKRNGET